jgi:hypothetical protein
MHKGTIEITNKGLGFKLINSTSFGESVFLVEFNQKSAKDDLFVKQNHENMPRDLHGKTLKDSTRLSTEGHETLPGGASRSTPKPPGPCWGPHVSSFQKVPPPPPRVASTLFLKSV